MSDDDLIARVRAVVQIEAGPGDGALADRLLHGTARRRRARRAGALTLAAVVLAGAGLAGASLRAGGGDSTLQIQGAGDPPLTGHQTPDMAGAVSVEQAARKGLDGTAECNAFAASNAGPIAGDVTTRLRLIAAYLTDTDGLEAWTREYSGAFTTWKVPPPIETIAMCWYAGDVPPDLSVGPATVTYTHQLVAVHVGAPSDGSVLRLDMRSAKPIPVLAPPVPAGTTAGAPLRAFPQPDGVPVVAELPPGPVLRPPDPADFTEPPDCRATDCADPSTAVIVRSETHADGILLDPMGVHDVTPGETVTLQLTLEVEPGQTISDVYLAVSTNSGTFSPGPDGPSGIDEILVRAPNVKGSRTFDVTWTVPEIPQVKQLVLDYRSDKYQAGTEVNRLLAQFVVPRGTSGN